MEHAEKQNENHFSGCDFAVAPGPSPRQMQARRTRKVGPATTLLVGKSLRTIVNWNLCTLIKKLIKKLLKNVIIVKNVSLKLPTGSHACMQGKGGKVFSCIKT